MRRTKVEGDVWMEFDKEMTLWNNSFITTKYKSAVMVKNDFSMPLVCPECGRKMKKEYDAKP